MHLFDYLNVSKLADHIKNGVVDVRLHDTLPLAIYCYSKRATFDQIWDDITCKTRGLIVEIDTLTIIARPFEKFFNLNHNGRPETELTELVKRKDFPVLFDKPDGSMGTYWRYKNHFGVATKGSFHSEQAEWATKWLYERLTKIPDSSLVGAWPVGYTPVFEIIAQSVQHHVVHYLPNEDNQLLLLALVNNETGAEMGPVNLKLWANINGLETVEFWDETKLSLYEAMTYDRPNKEGYVAVWYRDGQTPLRVKIKHQEFLKLQKIAHHTTPKTIFQALRDEPKYSGIIDEALQFGSPFLQSQVKDWIKQFNDEYTRLITDARELFKHALTCTTGRKEFAEFVIGTNKALAGACFNLLDEREMNLSETIWDLVEPLVKTIKYDETEDLG